MSDMNIAVEGSLSKASSRGINKADVVWMLGLYGTAIGAGVLFLPINAGVGGLWPLVAMLILALPLTFFAHRGLTRFVLSGSTRDGDMHQLGMTAPPRAILSLALILGLMAIVRLGGQVIVKAMSVLVFPFVITLMGLALYLIPHS